MPEEDVGQARRFTEKLNRLFDTIKKPDGERYSVEDVVTWIRAHRPEDQWISSSYVYLLRSGKRSNPTFEHLEALSAFFQVPGGYFFDGEVAADFEEQLELLNALRDSTVRYIAMRSSELTPNARSSIASLLTEMEGRRGRTAGGGGDDPTESES